MYYFVCVENCYEDYISEPLDSIRFNSFEEAKARVENSFFSGFDMNGRIKWYFPSCQTDGNLHNPDENDILECYQIINIIPSEKEDEWFYDCYCDDERAVFSLHRKYVMDYRGECRWENE